MFGAVTLTGIETTCADSLGDQICQTLMQSMEDCSDEMPKGDPGSASCSQTQVSVAQNYLAWMSAASDGLKPEITKVYDLWIIANGITPEPLPIVPGVMPEVPPSKEGGDFLVACQLLEGKK